MSGAAAGDALATPRVYAYGMAVAPDGQEGTFGGVASSVIFLADIPTGLFGGRLLQTFCKGSLPLSTTATATHKRELRIQRTIIPRLCGGPDPTPSHPAFGLVLCDGAVRAPHFRGRIAARFSFAHWPTPWPPVDVFLPRRVRDGHAGAALQLPAALSRTRRSGPPVGCSRNRRILHNPQVFILSKKVYIYSGCPAFLRVRRPLNGECWGFWNWAENLSSSGSRSASVPSELEALI